MTNIIKNIYNLGLHRFLVREVQKSRTFAEVLLTLVLLIGGSGIGVFATEVATPGSTFYYDFRVSGFDFDEHEVISKIGDCTYNGAQHGLEFTSGNGFSVQVAGNAKIYVSRCVYGGGTFTVTSDNGGTITPNTFDAKAAYDGVSMVVEYEGHAATLSFVTDANQCFVHSVKVVNEGAVSVKVADTKDKVTIMNNVTGAMVYYTTDGSTPTTTNYKDVFSDASCVVAVKDGWVKAISVKNGEVLGTDERFCRSTFAGFSWDFSNGSTLLGSQTSDFETGVIIDDRGDVHLVPVGEASSSIDICTAYHDGTHGYSGIYATIPVEGPVIVTIGNCVFSRKKIGEETYTPSKITISTSEGESVDLFPGAAGNCYDWDKSRNFVQYEYTGSATTLTIAGEVGNGVNVYLPYISVRDANTTRVKFVNRYANTLLGSVPVEAEVNEAHQVFIPENTTLYRKGWAVTGWEDAQTGTTYDLGRFYTFYENTTLYPVITRSTKALTDTDHELTVTWKFDQEDGAPRFTLHNSNSDPTSMTYVKSVDVEGSMVDVPLVLDASLNKIDNNDDRVNALPGRGAQFNDDTAIRLPAVYGMTVTLNASDKVDGLYSTSTNFSGDGNNAIVRLREGDTVLDDVEGVVTNGGKTISFTYTGDETTVDLFIEKAGSGETWGFMESVSVTYPVLPNVVVENVIDNADLATFPNENPEKAGTTAYRLITEGASHTNTGKRFRVGDVIALKATTDYGYTFTGFRKQGESGYLASVVKADSANFSVPAGITTIEAVYTRKALVKVTAVAADGQEQLGTIALAPKYSNFYNTLSNGVEAYFEPNTEVTATAEAAKDYIIKRWVDGATTTVDKNFYTFTLGSDARSIVAHFEQGKIGTVVFKIDEYLNEEGYGVHSVADPNTFNSAVSIAPPTQENVRSFYIPNYYTFFMNQYTLTHWVDQNGRKYSLGTYGSFSEDGQTLTLTPVFQHNIADKENRTRGDALYWDFRTMNLAQEIDMEEKNRNFFWTSKVSVEVIEDGQHRDHTRDVALWVHTNGEGFVRNSDLPEWVAFGQGTVFDIPSCAGATLKMYTYAEITSTTFDGHIPVLDEAATREIHERGEKGYVYSYVTSNPNPRVSIAIGDDYSYYKWIRCYSLPASMLDLHVDLDNAHGELVEIKGSGATETLELADGGVSFQQGDRVDVTFKRRFGFKLAGIVDTDRKSADGSDFPPIIQVSYGGENGNTITGVRMVTKNSDDFEDAVQQADGSWKGELFTLKEIPAAEGERESYELSFEITSHRNLQIQFEEKPTYYVTFNTGQDAIGTAPEAVWVEKGDKFTIPENRTMYYEYYTLRKWVDDDGNEYDFGVEYPAPSSDLRLYPVFENDGFSVFDIDAETKVTWELTKKKGAPTLEYERSSGILVAQLRKGDDFIDLMIDLDASEQNGKVNNAAYDDRCQINEHSVITFPANRNCVIELEGLDLIPAYVKIDGNTHDPARTISSTHVQGSTSHSVVFGDDGNDGSSYQTWCTAFSITYKPVENINLPEITSVSYDGTSLTPAQLASLKADKEIDIEFEVGTDDAFPVVVAETPIGSVSVTQADLSNRKAVICLKSAGGVAIEDYTINFIALENSNPELQGSPSIYVNTTGYNQSVTPLNQPVSGTVSIHFDRTMAAVGSSAGIKLASDGNPVGDALTAGQGSTLIFRYWNLDVNKDYTLTIPANTLYDVYNGSYSSEISITFRTVADIIDIEHRKFNWIVGVDGTLSEGINAANNAAGLARFYIFVPDGEHELDGNENIVPTMDDDATTLYDEEGRRRDELLGVSIDNNKTRISRGNVSIIGQSETGTKIYNKPIIEGLDYTATLHLTASATDFYAQDLTLENRFNYRKAMSNSQNTAARAVALQGHGTRMILKNVSLFSYQDTYYSSNVDDDPNFCGYFETCTVAGVVDWLCGGGNIWLDRCDIIHRDRSGNNIAAPHTNKNQMWGFVFNDCVIRPEVDEESLQYMTANDWTLARPWGSSASNSPACTFLNTTITVPPRNAGWGAMYGGMVLRFHEYKTKNAAGNLVSLGTRSLAACAPAAGSDDCILSDAEAALYKVNDVLEFDPTSYTAQRQAVTNISIEDGVLTWDASADGMDLCYFIFKKDSEGKWKYYANVAEPSLDFTTYGEDIREGIYMIRTANQRGGLGAFSEEIEYREAERFDLTISEVVPNTGKGWSTICLPNNAKVPVGDSDIKVYAAVSIDDNIITLKRVDYITANIGYVVYGDVGIYTFRGTSHNALETSGYGYGHDSYLSGNPGEVRVSASTTNCYTLAYKPNVSGVGFYRYTGTWLNPHKAYLDVEVFKQCNNSRSDEEDLLSKSFSKGIRFVFAPEEGTTDIPLLNLDATLNYRTDAIYDLSGRRVVTPHRGHVYITNGTKVLKK